MNQTLLSSFDTPFERVEHALSALREGRGVMVLDDENRENEGDMIFAAENMTVEQMALTIRHGSGIAGEDVVGDTGEDSHPAIAEDGRTRGA